MPMGLSQGKSQEDLNYLYTAKSMPTGLSQGKSSTQALMPITADSSNICGYTVTLTVPR